MSKVTLKVHADPVADATRHAAAYFALQAAGHTPAQAGRLMVRSILTEGRTARVARVAL